MSDLIIKPSGTSANFKVQNPSGTDKIVMNSSGTITTGTLGSGVTFPTGHVLRVLGDNYTGNLELTTSYQDVPSLSVNITLSSQSNKIAVMANLATYHYSTGTAIAGKLVKTIDSSTSLNYEVADYYNPSGSGIGGNISIMYFDTPNTTSEINYKIQAKEEVGSGFLNEDHSGTVNGVCSLMIYEIQG